MVLEVYLNDSVTSASSRRRYPWGILQGTEQKVGTTMTHVLHTYMVLNATFTCYRNKSRVNTELRSPFTQPAFIFWLLFHNIGYTHHIKKRQAPIPSRREDKMFSTLCAWEIKSPLYNIRKETSLYYVSCALVDREILSPVRGYNPT